MQSLYSWCLRSKIPWRWEAAEPSCLAVDVTFYWAWFVLEMCVLVEGSSSVYWKNGSFQGCPGMFHTCCHAEWLASPWLLQGAVIPRCITLPLHSSDELLGILSHAKPFPSSLGDHFATQLCHSASRKPVPRKAAALQRWGLAEQWCFLVGPSLLSGSSCYALDYRLLCLHSCFSWC